MSYTGNPGLWREEAPTVEFPAVVVQPTEEYPVVIVRPPNWVEWRPSPPKKKGRLSRLNAFVEKCFNEYDEQQNYNNNCCWH